MFLQLESDLDDSVSSSFVHIFSKRTTKNEKKISLLYLCAVWSKTALFGGFFMVNVLVHKILVLIARASSDGSDEPPHYYAQSRQALAVRINQVNEGSVQIHTTSPTRYI